MRATPRPSGHSVIERLLETPQRFEFFQAVRLLERLLIEHGVPEGRALRDYLRFDNSVSMSFPASQIESIRLHGTKPIAGLPALIEAIGSDPGLRIHITPTFIGLLGLAGVMPSHVTDDIARSMHDHQDGEARWLFDLFSSRIVSQFYQAWAKYRVDCMTPAARREHHLGAMLSVAGGPALRAQRRAKGNDGVAFIAAAKAANMANANSAAVAANAVGTVGADDVGGAKTRHAALRGVRIADEVIAFYAAAISQRPVSAVIVERVLSEYFRAPITLEPFVPSWYELSAGQRTHLGHANSTLGRDMVLGASLPRRDLLMRVKIGPLGLYQYEAFMPDGHAGIALGKMLALFDTGVRKFEVEVRLRAEEIPRAFLGPRAAKPVRLGMTFFLGAKPAVADQSMRYRLDL